MDGTWETREGPLGARIALQEEGEQNREDGKTRSGKIARGKEGGGVGEMRMFGDN